MFRAKFRRLLARFFKTKPREEMDLSNDMSSKAMSSTNDINPKPIRGNMPSSTINRVTCPCGCGNDLNLGCRYTKFPPSSAISRTLPSTSATLPTFFIRPQILKRIPIEIFQLILEILWEEWNGTMPALIKGLRGNETLYKAALWVFYQNNTFRLHWRNNYGFRDMRISAIKTIQNILIHIPTRNTSRHATRRWLSSLAFGFHQLTKGARIKELIILVDFRLNPRHQRYANHNFDRAREPRQWLRALAPHIVFLLKQGILGTARLLVRDKDYIEYVDLAGVPIPEDAFDDRIADAFDFPIVTAINRLMDDSPAVLGRVTSYGDRDWVWKEKGEIIEPLRQLSALTLMSK